jgi:flagellar biosynthesis protein FliR
MRVSLTALIIAVVIAFLTIGLLWAREPAGAFFGILSGFSSAAFWALGSVANAPWNARFNLFAALLAAGSLGFLAPADRVCNWHQMPLLCR